MKASLHYHFDNSFDIILNLILYQFNSLHEHLLARFELEQYYIGIRSGELMTQLKNAAGLLGNARYGHEVVSLAI